MVSVIAIYRVRRPTSNKLEPPYAKTNCAKGPVIEACLHIDKAAAWDQFLLDVVHRSCDEFAVGYSRNNRVRARQFVPIYEAHAVLVQRMFRVCPRIMR